MSRRAVMGVFLLGIVVLVGAFLVPGLRDTTAEDARSVIELRENESVELANNQLRVNATDVNESSSTVNVTVTELSGFEQNETSLGIGGSETLTLRNESVTVGLETLRGGKRAVVSVERSPYFGWPDGPRGFMSNIQVLVVAIGIVMMLGLVAMGVKLS